MRHYLKTAVEIDEEKPVLVDKYICGKEIEIDAICDGTDVLFRELWNYRTDRNPFRRFDQRISDI